MMPIFLIHKKLSNTKNLKNCTLKRMKKEETIDKLIEFVTQVPKEEDSDNRKFL